MTCVCLPAPYDGDYEYGYVGVPLRGKGGAWDAYETARARCPEHGCRALVHQYIDEAMDAGAEVTIEMIEREVVKGELQTVFVGERQLTLRWRPKPLEART